MGRNMDTIGLTDDALLKARSRALLVGRPELDRTPPCAPPFRRRLFLAGDFSRPGEVTAASGKPIAPSGEPGDKFMPLLESADERAVTLSADFER